MKMNSSHECEDKSESTLYKIGVFAAMNHMTVKALRFYEEQGLLMPAQIQPDTGYRYYTLSQMADLHRITALKKVGFTLEEIAKISLGADEQAALLKKKSELLAEIVELTKKLSELDGFIAGDTERLSAPVLIKTVPASTVAYMSVTLDSYDSLFERMPEMGALMEKAGCVCALPEYCFTCYPEPCLKDEGITAEICEAVTEAKRGTGKLRFKTLPEISAACIFHRGSYGTLPESYERLLRYIEDNGYEIAGEVRESYIDGVWNKEDERDWLSEIQIPVKPLARHCKKE